MPRHALLLLCLAISLGCDVLEELSHVDNNPKTSVRVQTRTVDPAMDTAIAEARRTLPDFLEVFNNPEPGQADFAVKKLYERGQYREHIWITELSVAGNEFRGVSGNDSPDTVGVRFGDPATVPLDEITDWMYTQEGVLVGGYTVRVIYGRLTPEEQRAFRRDAPYKLN